MTVDEVDDDTTDSEVVTAVVVAIVNATAMVLAAWLQMRLQQRAVMGTTWTDPRVIRLRSSIGDHVSRRREFAGSLRRMRFGIYDALADPAMATLRAQHRQERGIK